jgi:Fic family protein
MRGFDYEKLSKVDVPADIVRYLAQIHEFKGKQQLYLQKKPEVLDALINVAKIQSIGASNRIEGIRTTNKRLQEIAINNAIPHNRDEEEISGYQNVLETIHENYRYIEVKESIILQLHRDLYKFSDTGFGGRFKNVDNVIEEVDQAGNQSVRFRPLPAYETPAAMQNLCDEYRKAVYDRSADPLLIIPVFILDFLCIHPFSDGNGRMSRLLTLLLMYKSDYIVGKYISIEKMIEETKDNYYAVLQTCSRDWINETNEFWPFVRYMLGVILAAYRELDKRIDIVNQGKKTKSERVQEAIRAQIGLFTKSDIIDACPDISKITVENVLREMKQQRIIEVVETGRYAKWRLL